MGNPFTSTSVINYNTNPPPDDGSQVSNNLIKWATQKSKLADPLKNAFDTHVAATATMVGKIPGGAGITSVNSDYTVAVTDQGKMVRVTATATITTPDCTSATIGSPFLFAVVNDSSVSITLTGNNPGVQQTIDGATSLTLLPNVGYWLTTDGTNWFTYGRNFGQLVGSMMSYGNIVNGTIVESNASNAVTFALKTLAGNDPSASDPVLCAFRNATQTTGNYVFRSVTAALSLVISSGSTLGAPTGSVAFDISIVLFDDAGTICMGAINLADDYSIIVVPTIASSTAEGGAGAADSSKTFYTGTAVTSKAYIPFAQARYTSGLSTAGSWNVDPKLQLYGPGAPFPPPRGPKVYQVQESQTSGTNSSNTATNTGAYITVTLNTDVINQITGASRSGNVLTLPAGTYTAYAEYGSASNGGNNRIRLRDTTNSVTLIGGPNQNGNSGSASGIPKELTLAGVFALSGTVTVELQVRTTGTIVAAPAASFGDPEVYVNLVLTRLP